MEDKATVTWSKVLSPKVNKLVEKHAYALVRSGPYIFKEIMSDVTELSELERIEFLMYFMTNSGR